MTGRDRHRSEPYTRNVRRLKRCRQPEIMDSPLLDEGRHRRALDALGRINLLSRTAPQVWRLARPVMRAERPVRIVDVACGGGDVALRLEAMARRCGIAVEVIGCDASAVAVQRAAERRDAAGLRARFVQLDALRDRLPGADIVYSTLFLHHLDEGNAVRLLARMADAARRMLIVQDLERTVTGWLLAFVGVHLLTRSDVAHTDGPRSVRGAYTRAEAVDLARRAGLEARVLGCWPRRYNLVVRFRSAVSTEGAGAPRGQGGRPRRTGCDTSTGTQQGWIGGGMPRYCGNVPLVREAP